MSHNYDNWEKLVDAVLLKLHYLELCALSETSSECSSSSRILGSPPKVNAIRKTEQAPRGWLPRIASVAGGTIRGWLPRRPEQRFGFMSIAAQPVVSAADTSNIEKWLSWEEMDLVNARQPELVNPLAAVESKLGRQRLNPNPSIQIVPSDACQCQPRISPTGWPSWLISVAGEVLNDCVRRRADSFEKIDKIGQGRCSNVYLDLVDGRLVALKKVRFGNLEAESVHFMAREILILSKLNHPNIIKLKCIVTSRMSYTLYLVFEYMKLDLATILSNHSLKRTEPQIKWYILRGVDYLHSQGVLHRDIKGSDLLIDNKGDLKIADFGFASSYNPQKNHPMTSRVGTLWYRSPELIIGATHYGAAVDLWSIGCIFAEFYAGKPIMCGRTEVEQLHRIFELCGSPSEEYWKKLKLPHATVFKPTHLYKCRLAETFKDIPAPALALL